MAQKKENKMKSEKTTVTLDKKNVKDFKGKAGTLTLSYRDKMLKVFQTQNVYALYHTLNLCSFPRQTIQYHSNPSLCPNQ